jgi:hypothetical protein
LRTCWKFGGFLIKTKVVPVLTKLSTTLWSRMGEWMYR